MSGFSDRPAEFWALAREVCTPREVEYLQLRAQGLGAGAISVRLGLSYTRVGQLRRHAERKLREAMS